jgi:flagellar hook protein FlgE
MAAKPTSRITIIGNINSATELYDSDNDQNYTLSDLTVYDSLGESHTLTLKIMKTGANEYEYEVLENDDKMTITAGATGGAIAFDGSGKLSSATTPALPLTFTNGASDITIDSSDIVFDANGLTQYANATSLVASQNGYTSGSLTDYSIDGSGTIMGVFSNGKQQAVAVIALATFSNISGLVKAGNNEYVSSWNSGEAQIGMAGTGTRGKIATYSLEMSNVDLANEFTEMIVAQRGFQANSRIITTSDQLLEELVNLKR